MVKPKVVVVGAGLAGLPAAFQLREVLGSTVDLTVINPSPQFQFVPSNPWIAIGWRNLQETTVDLEPALAQRGIAFLQDMVAQILPDSRQIETASGVTVNYDYCVLATGAESATDLIDGFHAEPGRVQSICTGARAVDCYTACERLMKTPGPVVIGAAQGASCFGPAYEFILILDQVLRQRNQRDQVPLTFVTSEPYVGHLGLGGVGNSRHILERILKEREIRVVVNAFVNQVGEESIVISQRDYSGQTIRTARYPAALSMLIPPLRGASMVANVKNLTDSKGFVLVDEYQRNPTYPEIYAAGACVAIASAMSTPVPLETPKTGLMIESMIAAIAQNICLDIAGRPPSTTSTRDTLYLTDFGTTGAAFLAIPQSSSSGVAWAREGQWVRTTKVLFERYFLKRMRLGQPLPAYQQLVGMVGATFKKETASALRRNGSSTRDARGPAS